MIDGVNPTLIKVHPRFHEMLKILQTDRIKKGKEDVQTKVALWRLTKTITNMVESNPELYESLVEVDIENVQH